MKICSRCKVEKDESEFSKKAKSDRLKEWCKKCHAAYCRRWYLLNKEKHRRYVHDHNDKRKTHTCKQCGRGEPEVSFYIKREGTKYYRRFICYECDVAYRRKYKTTEESKRRENQRKAAKQRSDRATNTRSWRFILRDSKAADRNKHRKNDLDAEFIKDLIAHGCSYCDDKQGRVGLDRIDNSKGHTRDNVNPCCWRCNWLRRDMPYEAWMELVPAIRRAQRKGLFGDWHAGTNKTRVRKVSAETLSEIMGL